MQGRKGRNELGTSELAPPEWERFAPPPALFPSTPPPHLSRRQSTSQPPPNRQRSQVFAKVEPKVLDIAGQGLAWVPWPFLMEGTWLCGSELAHQAIWRPWTAEMGHARRPTPSWEAGGSPDLRDRTPPEQPEASRAPCMTVCLSGQPGRPQPGCFVQNQLFSLS